MGAKIKVAVAMSGGVDSSVVAALLKEKGYNVTGITLKILDFDKINCNLTEKQCCSPESIKQAREVCLKLKIPFYVMDVVSHFNKFVIDDFLNKYLTGYTPNPCIRCNRYIKFGILLDRVIKSGYNYLATGHYARIEFNKKYILKKAVDKKKDQSYFLSTLSQKQLRYILFLLGDFKKEKVRRIASNMNLPVAKRKDSEDICFIEGGDYREFIKKRLSKEIKPGNIISKDGKILGVHKGIPFYTIGQRRGLNISGSKPYYVIKTDSRTNTIVVGSEQDLLRKKFWVNDLNSIEKITKPQKVKIKIRYQFKEAEGVIYPSNEVIFKRAQKAITPGQQAVFYKGDKVFASAMIAKDFKEPIF